MPSPRRHRPQLTTKTQPAQQRATETFERLLEAAAQTLADVGIERWSTNLVCEHAGVSPPALYRYFPNKYALLTELSRRLMERQNECIAHHIHEGVFAGGIPALEKALRFTPRNPANGLVRITDPALFRPYSFFDTIPPGADAYVLSHVIHDWREDKALAILANVRRAMPAHAKLLLIEMVLPPGNIPPGPTTGGKAARSPLADPGPSGMERPRPGRGHVASPSPRRPDRWEPPGRQVGSGRLPFDS